MAIKTRFLEEVGKVVYLRRYWEDGHPCNSYPYHNALREINRFYDVKGSQSIPTMTGSFPDEMWPMECKYCGHMAPLTATRQIFTQRLYRATDGTEVLKEDLKPGDLFFLRDFLYHERDKKKCIAGWENCTGEHLHVVLPNGQHWDIDSRASNCTMPEDKIHRCWVRHGDPRKGEPVHVDKHGLTCQAGAGSIDLEGYHGFLHHGCLSDNP